MKIKKMTEEFHEEINLVLRVKQPSFDEWKKTGMLKTIDSLHPEWIVNLVHYTKNLITQKINLPIDSKEVELLSLLIAFLDTCLISRESEYFKEMMGKITLNQSEIDQITDLTEEIFQKKTSWIFSPWESTLALSEIKEKMILIDSNVISDRVHPNLKLQNRMLFFWNKCYKMNDFTLLVAPTVINELGWDILEPL